MGLKLSFTIAASAQVSDTCCGTPVYRIRSSRLCISRTCNALANSWRRLHLQPKLFAHYAKITLRQIKLDLKHLAPARDRAGPASWHSLCSLAAHGACPFPLAPAYRAQLGKRPGQFQISHSKPSALNFAILVPKLQTWTGAVPSSALANQSPM